MLLASAAHARVLIFFLIIFSTYVNEANGEEFVPMQMNTNKMMKMKEMVMSRKIFGGYQVCSACQCCVGGNRRSCVQSSCCYSIICNIPGKPPGTCTFGPRSCNCLGCSL
ncbi:hypothetical protein AAHE18_U089800 [Arachis hypogaea]|uniref:DUF7866 domain-containing protein n=1 Tax=Arachis hypogaea TaxID=3818 RepID=A0A445BJ98_ARAHY|nr:uncharacterized protein DS421_9g270240 [Arachis hypogaea]RYR38756.1 hypothetical protein Ahy_A09g043939 [Arachis hypogaea]